MPKLNFETNAELSDIISRIGLENVFSDDADFSGIADKAVHVSSVLQKTKLELDENGTKAWLLYTAKPRIPLSMNSFLSPILEPKACLLYTSMSYGLLDTLCLEILFSSYL